MVLDNDATQAKIDRLQVLEKSISDKRRKIREAMGCLELTIPDTIKRDGGPDIIQNKYNTQTGTELLRIPSVRKSTQSGLQSQTRF